MAGLLASSCSGPTPALPVDARYSVPGSSPRVLERIAFGSCNDINREQPLWDPILAAKPDLFIWTGDIVYADRIQVLAHPNAMLYLPLPQLHDTSALVRAYAVQRQQPGYARLLARTPVIGVYDDHDFGKNNGGGEYPYKAQTGRLLLDFLNVPPDSPRRRREGVYGTYTFGVAGRSVRVILLDPRFHRGRPGPLSEVLGRVQEDWLLETLKRSSSDVHLLVSGFQIMPDEHPYESWGQFPGARARLYELLNQTRPKGLLLVSGDRHFAEFSQARLPSGLALREITASGLTHVYERHALEPNRHRRGPLIRKLNFGLVTVDWQRGIVTVEVRGVSRSPYITQVFSLR